MVSPAGVAVQQTLSVDIDAVRALAFLRHAEKRMGWTTAAALNKTAENIQEVQRRHVRGVFTVRKADFIKREAAIIKPRAKPEALWVRIRAGSKKGLFLSVFEKGGERFPQKAIKAAGVSAVAVPKLGGPARPSVATIIPEPLWVGRIGLGKGSKSKQVKASGMSTFISGGGRAIMQRAAGATKTKVLYILAKRKVPLRAVLHFIINAKREASKFPATLSTEIQNTLRFQSGR